MVIDYRLIGERIRKARIDKGYAQQKLAEEVDVGVGYISRVEHGAQINLKKLAEISLALEVPMEELVVGISVKSEIYLDKELTAVLAKCTPEKQRLIYNMAKMVLDSNFD